MDRRHFLEALGVGAAALSFPRLGWAQPSGMLLKTIPSTGEKIPALGLGTWITFNVVNSKSLRDRRTDIVRAFFEQGGRLIDSSPMYGSAEEVVGYAYEKLGKPKSLFSATKIWTGSTEEGKKQFAEAQKLWGVKVFDLMQIHNLDNWEGHLATLQKLKSDGLIRYIGLTTSHGRRHDELMAIMRKHPSGAR